jgi:hypothetical protein
MDAPAPRPRKPFVQAIREGVGDGFLIAVVLGSAYYFFTGGIQGVYENVPLVCFSTAVFCGLIVAIDSAMVSARGKEEPVLNCAVAMGGASWITALPMGFQYACYSALIGGASGGLVAAGIKFLEDRCQKPQAQQAGDPGLPVYTACPTPPV